MRTHLTHAVAGHSVFSGCVLCVVYFANALLATRPRMVHHPVMHARIEDTSSVPKGTFARGSFRVLVDAFGRGLLSIRFLLCV